MENRRKRSRTIFGPDDFKRKYRKLEWQLTRKPFERGYQFTLELCSQRQAQLKVLYRHIHLDEETAKETTQLMKFGYN